MGDTSSWCWHMAEDLDRAGMRRILRGADLERWSGKLEETDFEADCMRHSDGDDDIAGKDQYAGRLHGSLPCQNSGADGI
jgi:hypothetical protein